MRIAFGTDQATALTDGTVATLKDMGHEVDIVGAGIDWPDVGRFVGEAVAFGEADAGVVCCWTGTGVSIAANKVPGVRAALCTDAETARGARRWNDANVLAMGLRLTSPDVAAEMLAAFLTTPVGDDEQRLIDLVEPAVAGRGAVEPTLPVVAGPRAVEPTLPAAARPRAVEPTLPAAAGPRAVEPTLPAVADLRLTEWTSCGGCAAKWGAAPLTALVRQLADSADASLLVGLAPFDDAAVYRVGDDLAVVSTTDFFPPLVDDPADFGAIAAANACSDVFAMGGRVVMALNIAAFPERLPSAAIEAILSAAAATVAAAGGTIAGGHTIRSDEPIFGLAVQGLVDPRRVWAKSGARPGDSLVLSKPLGSGIVLAGAAAADKTATIEVMRGLNRSAAEALQALEGDGPHAVTDVTGYGLLGHGWEMAERSAVTLRFAASTLPLYPGALAAARQGTRTGGDPRNRAHLEGRVTSTASEELEAIGYDPQTSGGLLAAVTADDAERLVAAGVGFVVVGDVIAGPAGVELLG